MLVEMADTQRRSPEHCSNGHWSTRAVNQQGLQRGQRAGTHIDAIITTERGCHQPHGRCDRRDRQVFWRRASGCPWKIIA